MKTKEKIVSASLELFNLKGERNVTTNHIAASMDISPGNLYYHFRNKQEIIHEIFKLYAKELLERFAPLTGQRESLVLLKHCLDSIFSLMWKYRFFYANLPEILNRDLKLHQDYIEVQATLQQNLIEIIRSFIQLDLLDITEQEIPSLITNLHLVAVGWLGYRSAMSLDESITESVIHEGMLQLIAVVTPHATPQGREQLQLLADGVKALHA